MARDRGGAHQRQIHDGGRIFRDASYARPVPGGLGRACVQEEARGVGGHIFRDTGRVGTVVKRPEGAGHPHGADQQLLLG